MFGYVRAEKSELKIREYEIYKAVYCSLCRKLGKSYGLIARMTLSYDFTFLALLNMSLENSCPKFERRRCAFNPFKKCNYCTDDRALDMPAAAAMIMLYYKLLDDISDTRGFKRLGYRLLRPMFSHARKKAAGMYPDIETAVSRYISKQNAIEADGCSQIDRAADPTAEAMAEIFAQCSSDNTQKRVLQRLGYCIGRYVYLLDAACDLEDDIKNGSYNVLKYGFDGKSDVKAYSRSRVEAQLYFCINEAARAFELIDIKKYKPILGNVIYLGLEATFDKELKK